MGSARCDGGEDAPGAILRRAGASTGHTTSPAGVNEVELLREQLLRYEGRESRWYEFLTGLTPAGLLVLNGNLALRMPNPPPGERFRNPRLAGTLGAVQRLLGGGLASVSACHRAQTQWLLEIAAAGRRRYEFTLSWRPGRTPVLLYGYQLLGPLLRHGAYDDRFLGIVGGDMVHFELAHGGGRCWSQRLGIDAHNLRLDWTGGSPTDPTGLDPLMSLLKAMDRNPQGAADVLIAITDPRNDHRAVGKGSARTVPN